MEHVFVTIQTLFMVESRMKNIENTGKSVQLRPGLQWGEGGGVRGLIEVHNNRECVEHWDQGPARNKMVESRFEVGKKVALPRTDGLEEPRFGIYSA